MSKARGRPFAPGNQLGRGRPKGSRNKSKSPGQDLFDEYAPHLIRKCIGMALQGNLTAMRLCMERTSPARAEACIRMRLSSIETAQDLNKAAEKVTKAVGRGEITPSQGGKVMTIFEARSRIIEKSEFESRLEKLEKNLAGSELPKAA